MKFTRYGLAAVGVALVSLSMVLTDVPQVMAQSKAILVQVINSSANPVPTVAQGTTQVAGSVAAQQSGAWNVGITEFSAKQPFQLSVDVALAVGVFHNNESPREFAVPAGKRLIIEHVSYHAMLDLTDRPQYSMRTTVNGEHAFHTLVPVDNSPPFLDHALFVASQQMRIYADPDTVVQHYFARGIAENRPALINLGISGYLVDVP